MSALAIVGIGRLVTCESTLGSGPLGVVTDAAVVVESGLVTYAGPRTASAGQADDVVDVAGRCVMPGFVDSHTHLVFAGDRAHEFARRMAGEPYHPGGILETVAATRSATPEQLERSARALASEAMRSGTTTVEVKSGYGLDAEHESRQLAVARRITDEATLLAAHVLPARYEHRRDDYLRMVCGEMVPAAAGTARWCDAFCERGAFDSDECRAVLEAGRRAGLGPRLHANQLGPGPGVRLACELGAASADHCTHLSAADVDSLATSATVATLLPISDFCTRQPYPDGRRLLDAGAAVALATNCNPGSAFSTSMPLAMALGVRECGLSVEEAVLAATVGGARALRRPDVGRLAPGCRADAVVLDAAGPAHLLYRLGSPPVAAVLLAGTWVGGPPAS